MLRIRVVGGDGSRSAAHHEARPSSRSSEAILKMGSPIPSIPADHVMSVLIDPADPMDMLDNKPRSTQRNGLLSHARGPIFMRP